MSKAEELAQYLVNLPIGSWEEHAKNKEAAEHLREQGRLLRQALEALESANNINLVGSAYSTKAIGEGFQKIEAAITAIKEALK